MNRLIRFRAVVTKELRQLSRDRLTFGMIIGIPVMQMLLFGFAINTDVRNLKAAVADQANSSLSRQFVTDLEQTQVLNFVERVDTAQQLEQLLRSGRVSIGIYIPADLRCAVGGRNRLIRVPFASPGD